MNWLRLMAVFAALLGSNAAHSQVDEPERLRIHGSNVLGERLVPSLVVNWLKSIEYVQIKRRDVGPLRIEISAIRDGQRLVVEIEKRGTASGFSDIASGEAEIAMTARPPTAREIDEAWQLGDLHSPGQEWVVALDGLSVVVSPSNPVSVLGTTQLRDILSGKVRDWKQVGGHPGPIHLHLLSPGSGTEELASRLVLNGAKSLRDAIRHDTEASAVAAVIADPQAIAIIGLRAPRDGTRNIAMRSGSQSVLPGTLALRSEDYPLARRLHFHTAQLITALGRGFVQYAVSPAGQAVVERGNFVSFSLTGLDAARPVDLPREYLQIVGPARRLPIALRFSTGLDLFDSRSRQDLDRLSVFLARPENAGRKLVLVGFANPEPKSPYQALSLSQERVDYVASEMLALEMKVVTVRGLGGRMSLVDPGQPGSRYRNDRVEVWLR